MLRGTIPLAGCGGLSLVRHGTNTILADDDEDGADGDDRPLLDENLRDLAGGGRGNLDRGLVRLDLDERLVLGHLVSLRYQPARDLAFGQALAEVGKLELVRHGRNLSRATDPGVGGNDQHSQTTLHPPEGDSLLVAGELGRDLARDVADLQRLLLVPDRDRVRVVLVVRLGHERQSPPRLEGRIAERFGPKRHPRNRDHEDSRVLPAHNLAGRCVPEPVAGLRPLEQQAKALAQASLSPSPS